MQNKLRLFFATLFLAILLIACQSGPDGNSSLAVDWEATPITDRESAAEPTRFVPTEGEPLPTVEIEAIEVDDSPIPELPPTPIPAGVYVKEGDGFTFYYPSGWEVTDSSGERLQIRDPELGVFLNVISGFKDDETNFDSYVEEFTGDEIREAWGMAEVELVKEEEVPFATDYVAQTATFATIGDDGSTSDLWIGYAESETREFLFLGFADTGIFEARKATLSQMLLQAEVGSIRLFGLDREDTVVLLGGEPAERSFDPARTEGSAAGAVGMLYSGLVRMSPQLQVVPDLAESWQINDDGTVYTFTLRDGLTFASGQPLTTADIKASWNRAANPDTDSSTVETYMGDIVGVEAVAAGEADEISGIEIIDDRTLVVTLDGPKPYFLAKLTYPVSYIVNTETVDADDEEWVYEPDPSGPFTLHERREGEALVYKRNDAYHTPSAVDGVVFLVGRVGSSISLFEAGEIDVAYLGAADAEEARKPSNDLHDQWVSTTSMCTGFMLLNNENPPFDDVNVRRAFALATDKVALNELLSEGSNLVANTVLPPAMPGYSATTAEASLAYDPDAARAALAESSYADSLPPIAISTSGFGDSERDDLNAIIEQWREVLGVDVTISFLDPYNFTEAIAEEDVQLASYGWCADYPDPENFLDIIFHTGSEFNVSGYSNPEVDALLEQARVELDVGRRVALYQELETILLSEAAVIPLSHGVSDAVVNPRLQGFVLAPMGAPIMHLLSFAPDTGGE